MGGPTLWQNPHYVSPNTARALTKRKKGAVYQNRIDAKNEHKEHLAKHAQGDAPLSSEAVFADEASEEEENEDGDEIVGEAGEDSEGNDEDGDEGEGSDDSEEDN